MNRKRKIITAILTLAMALSLCACAVKTEIKPDSDGKYSAVYEKLKNLDRTSDGTMKYGDFELYADDAMAFPTATNEEESVNSAETEKTYSKTNTQVDGIDESDIVKTDGKYIYVSSGNDIKIISAEGENTKFVSRLTSADEEKDENISGMYISGNKLVVIVTKYGYWTDSGREESTNETYAKIYDLTDIENPKLVSEAKQDGWYQDSRMKDGVLYLVSTYYVWEYSEEKPETYIPNVCDTNGTRLVDADCIVIPDIVDSSAFVVVSAVNTENAEIMSTNSMVGAAGTVYMSNSGLYLVNSTYRDELIEEYTEDIYKVKKYENSSESEIVSFSFEDGKITSTATGNIPGTPINSFALDEKDGFLRIVVTENRYTYKEYYDEKHDWANYEYDSDPQTSSLYVLDKNLAIAGSITGLAEDERVYSVRFMGDTGYFVTFKQVDPLFSVDLSNPYAPKIIGELKIPGFSTYMQSYSDNLLFGIGNDTVDNGEFITTGNMKLSMFNISDPTNVTECNKLSLDESYSEALYDHHAILVDGNKGIIGFASADTYFIYGYGDEGFYKRAEIGLSDEEFYWASSRGLYIGEAFYIVNNEKVMVLDMNEFTKTIEINL